MKIEINKLSPHPDNHRVYGYEDNMDLITRITESNWIKPILITKGLMIISGHRRVAACKALNINEIEFEYVPDDPLIQLELFVGENFYRVKTNSQKAQEAKIYIEIEKHKAYNRKVEAGNQNLGHSSVVETIPPLKKGKTRDIVGEKVGLSGKSLEKAQQVLDKIDSTYDVTFVEFFTDTLNENIDAASKLVTKPDEIIQEVFEKTEGNPKLVSGVIRELEQEELKSKLPSTPIPTGRFQVIYMDLTSKSIESLLQTDLSSCCELDCTFFFWVRPEQLKTGLKVCENWGLTYRTCLVWNKDVLSEVSEEGEILLVSTKGNPKLIFKNTKGSTEKPEIVRDMIKTGYKTPVVELHFGEGWEIWKTGVVVN